VDSEIYNKIKNLIGEEHVTDSDFEKIFYSSDVSPIPDDLQQEFGTLPDLIARPKNTKEVSEIVKLALENKIPIIPRGGASWWLGGAVPYNGGIVLDLTSINEQIELDEKTLTVTVDCGVTWKELSDLLERNSYFIGTYPGSAVSATIGGWLSTGGVGVGSYKYGSVGDMVRSLEVVLPNGKIIETGNKELATNSSGYNLKRLIIGSEGTLGIITKATLKIIPKSPDGPYHFSYTFQDLKSCQNALEKIVSSRILPYHIAFGDKKHFEFLRSIGKEGPKGEIVLCIILEGEKEIIDFGKMKLNELSTSAGGVLSCEHSTTDSCQECTIEFRGRQVSVHPVPGEIFVGLNQFYDTISKIHDLIGEMNLDAQVIGNMVDRRTVMFMPYYIYDKEYSGPFMAFHQRLAKLAFELGGRSVGLGLYFSSNLSKIHDVGSIEIMRAIKKSIDPHNIMNPGKTVAELELLNLQDDIS
jgi:glycolate oxidase